MSEVPFNPKRRSFLAGVTAVRDQGSGDRPAGGPQPLPRDRQGRSAIEVRAGLNPGVKIVPALTWAVGMLQERGFTYEKL